MKDPVNLSLFSTEFTTYYESTPYHNDPFIFSIWEAVGLENERCEDRFTDDCKGCRSDETISILEKSWPMGWRKFKEMEYVCKEDDLTFVFSSNLPRIFFMGRTNEVMCMESKNEDLASAILDLRQRYEDYVSRK